MFKNISEKLNCSLEGFAFVLLNVILADICIFGAGRIIEFGPLTFRMITLLILFAVCIPLFFKNFKLLLKSKYVCSVMVFGILVILAAVIGVLNHNRTNLIITDIKGFIYFAFLPCAVVLINSYEKILVLAKTSMYSAMVQGLVHITFIGFYIVDVSWLDKVARFCDERRFFYVSYRISSVNVRVSFLSLACLLLGIVFSIYFSTKNTKIIFKFIYPFITAICGFALFVSYTRSVYLAVGITVILLLISFFILSAKKQRIGLLKHIAVTLVVFAVIITGFKIKTGENYFSYGLSRALVGIDIFKEETDNLEIDNDENNRVENNSVENNSVEKDSFYQNTITSDNLREKTISELISNIKKSPIIGLGLGAEIPSRPDGLNEYFFLDLFSKMGIIGLLVYLSPVIFMIIQLIELFKKKNKKVLHLFAWFCVLLGLIAYSYFTPCMNSSVGIMVYCFIMAVFESYKKLQTDMEGQHL